MELFNWVILFLIFSSPIIYSPLFFSLIKTFWLCITFSASIKQISSFDLVYLIIKANLVHSDIDVCNKFKLYPIILFKNDDFPVEYFPLLKILFQNYSEENDLNL